jgi:ABC-2 type transport system permease protein
MTVLRGLRRLTCLEIKIFLREPLGAIGSIVFPVVMYVVIGRVVGRGVPSDPMARDFILVLPVLIAVMIQLNAVISLIAIISIYREGGILKRLRATPLRPWTILSAHVIAKLVFTAVTVALMVMAGRRYSPVDMDIPVVNVTLALLFSTFSVMSMGFLIASLVPTARFAQPIAGAIFYPMIGLSGLFYPIAVMPPALRAVASVLPLTSVVSLLRGMLRGDAWSAHTTDLASLVLVFVVCAALSARVFRWE